MYELHWLDEHGDSIFVENVNRPTVEAVLIFAANKVKMGIRSPEPIHGMLVLNPEPETKEET